MLNIIDSDLGQKIKKISQEKDKETDMAIVLYSLKEIIHGYYSTKEPNIPTTIAQIKYNNKDYCPIDIVRMIDKDYISNLEKNGLVPFSAFGSLYPNSQGLDFKMFIFGDVKFEKVQEIEDIIEQRWEKNARSKLNLALLVQYGKNH